MKFLNWLADHPDLVMMALMTVAGLVWGQPKVAAALADRRAQRIFSAAHIAFHAVEEVAATTGLPPGVSKTVAFLDKIDALLEAGGHATLDASEHPLALQAAQAINFQNERGAQGPRSAPSPTA